MLKNLKGKVIDIDGDKFKVLDDDCFIYILHKWESRVGNRHEANDWTRSCRTNETGMHVYNTAEVLVLQSIDDPKEKPIMWVEDFNAYHVVK